MPELSMRAMMIIIAMITPVGGFCGFRAGWDASRRDHDARMARICWLSIRKGSIQRGQAHPNPGEWSPLLREWEAMRARERGRAATSECLTILDMYEVMADHEARRDRENPPSVMMTTRSIAEARPARSSPEGRPGREP